MFRFPGVLRLIAFSFLFFVFSSADYGQTDTIYRLPAGTRIRLALDAEINSRVSSLNDTFLAFVVSPVTIRDTLVLPAGTSIEGRVVKVTRAAVGGRSGKLDIAFETINISNVRRNIEGVLISPLNAVSSTTFSLVTVFGGTAAGTAIGAATRSQHGLLIGAATGAAAGIGIALLSKGKDVRLKKGQEFEIELKKDVILPPMDY